jgi:NDP-sugar pyrophosphorylase family protein
VSDIAALVLAAGEGRRLRPLTTLRPKPLCPVDLEPLLDRVLRMVGAVVEMDRRTVAVNAHHLADQVVRHVAGRAHVSVEEPMALGTAGAVGQLRPWLDGRDVLIVNGDAYFHGDVGLAPLVAGWDRVRPRLLVVEDHARPDFDGRWRFAGISLLPWSCARRLAAEPSGLYEAVWSNVAVDLVPTPVTAVDCGTPADYLRANLLASGGRSVVDPTAEVRGSVERCVVWEHSTVRAGEHLRDCIRARTPDGADVTVSAA